MKQLIRLIYVPRTTRDRPKSRQCSRDRTGNRNSCDASDPNANPEVSTGGTNPNTDSGGGTRGTDT